MSGFHVELKGIPELQAGTKRLAGNIDQAAPGEFAHAADDVAGQVRATVPHRTGRLAGSVNARTTSNGASISMGDGVPYAQFVEYGGRGHPRSAQGNYLYPAAMDAGPQLEAAGERAARREIGSMTWPSP